MWYLLITSDLWKILIFLKYIVLSDHLHWPHVTSKLETWPESDPILMVWKYYWQKVQNNDSHQAFLNVHLWQEDKMIKI